MTLAPADPPALQAAVLDWYVANGRDLAFRRSRDPWAILVSEVIAQQTQAARAAEAWERFMQQFPTPAALAAASPAAVIRAWRGLGYNRRAVRLRDAAIAIVRDHDGRVPDDLDALTRLPGVGPYTARAVLAFAFDRPVATLDTNVRRVLDRVLGPLPASSRGAQLAADSLVPPGAPAAWGHALMDIGAMLCTARVLRCEACPARPWCVSATDARDDAAPRADRTSRRAAPFPSTTRWLRGRILDRLRDAADDAWVTFDRPLGDHSLANVLRELARLADDGLLERRDGAPQRARLVPSTD